MSIVPIETYYNGINYRSRLEARWATFLTAMGIKFHYEYNAYRLATASYLPDFYIPGDFSLFIEVKPDVTQPDKVWNLCEELTAATETTTVLLMGPVSEGVRARAYSMRPGAGPNAHLPVISGPVKLSEVACWLVPAHEPLRFDHAIHLAKNNRFGT